MNIHNQAKYAISLVKQYGIHDFTLRFMEWFDTRSRNNAYSQNHTLFFPAKEELDAQRTTHFPYEPTISIVVPAYETDPKFLRQLVDGVLAQTYPKLELCIADGSKTNRVKDILDAEYPDSRINYTRLTENGGISKNTNAGFETVHGEYIALLDHDDLLTENALFEMVQALNSYDERPDMVYSDEDKTTGDTGLINNPTFKSDYNEEFLRRTNYFCHFLIFSKELLDKVGGLDSNYDGAQDFEFVLRCSAAGAKIAHVPKILYHWRIHPASTAFDPGSKLYAYENGAKAIRSYLAKKEEEAEVALTKDLGFYTVDYYLKKQYHVTVFVHDENQAACMRRLTTAQDNITVDYVVTTNLTNDNLLNASGDYLVIAKEGVTPITDNWLNSLLSFCQWKRVGIVGTKNLSAKNRVTNCGYTYDCTGQLAPLFAKLPRIYRGYCHRADGPSNISIASLDLCMIRKDALQTIRGIDHTLSAPYRDADLSFQLLEAGRQVILDTNVHTHCKTSSSVVSRSGIYAPSEVLMNRWSSVFIASDPIYNPNLDLSNGAFRLRH